MKDEEEKPGDFSQEQNPGNPLIPKIPVQTGSFLINIGFLYIYILLPANEM